MPEMEPQTKGHAPHNFTPAQRGGEGSLWSALVDPTHAAARGQSGELASLVDTAQVCEITPAAR